jgi:hypothetical protein
MDWAGGLVGRHACGSPAGMLGFVAVANRWLNLADWDFN